MTTTCTTRDPLPEPHDDDQDQQRGQDPHRLLREHCNRNGESCAERDAIRQRRALQHDDSGEHQQRAGKPCKVVVVDSAREVLRLGQQRNDRGGPEREHRAAREEPACDQVDGEDGEHSECDGQQADQPWVASGELRDDCAQQVVQRRLLALGLACRWQAEMVGDAVDVVEVRELIGRGADGRDARVGDREPGKDGDQGTEHDPLDMPAPESRQPVGNAHGICAAMSARTQTVSGKLSNFST